jgi:hypothetical protein
MCQSFFTGKAALSNALESSSDLSTYNTKSLQEANVFYRPIGEILHSSFNRDQIDVCVLIVGHVFHSTRHGHHHIWQSDGLSICLSVNRKNMVFDMVISYIKLVLLNRY